MMMKMMMMMIILMKRIMMTVMTMMMNSPTPNNSDENKITAPTTIQTAQGGSKQFCPTPSQLLSLFHHLFSHSLCVRSSIIQQMPFQMQQSHLAGTGEKLFPC
uniref:Alternative protein CASQ2 n=1 Tax=Homo sapiens TaxID=9606 RepID=L8EC86_HUMAN|nr:alternative protein CASQ2 [Homo sapiens]